MLYERSGLTVPNEWAQFWKPDVKMGRLHEMRGELDLRPTWARRFSLWNARGVARRALRDEKIQGGLGG